MLPTAKQKIILQYCDLKHIDPISNMQHLSRLFFCGSSSLRLSKTGYQAFTSVDIWNAELPLNDRPDPRLPFTTQEIIYLNSFLRGPFYCTKKSITLFDKEDMLEFSFLGCSLSDFISMNKNDPTNKRY